MKAIGYFQTPNKNIPLQDRGKGEIAPVAMEQLRRFEQAADTWPVVLIRRREIIEISDNGTQRNTGEYRDCMVCKVCLQNLWFPTDEFDNNYNYSTTEKRALIVGHIRRLHEKLVNEDGTCNLY